MKFHLLYNCIITLIFLAIAIIFTIMPRPSYSELEKRELAKFPDFSIEKLTSGTFTNDVSQWFSDSEPFRDELMHLSMTIKKLARIELGEENITFHASSNEMSANGSVIAADTIKMDNDSTAGFDMINENAKIANNGILIIGQGDKVRALMAYGGTGSGCTGYAEAANKYQETFPNINVYCMLIPTSVEFYCPEKAKKRSNPQRPTIDNVNAHLKNGVKPVDVYYTLRDHADEDIYLRTDHHWAPLGAYYAAEKFADVAGVPFKALDNYDKHVVRRFVGSMYGYSQDIAIKNAPEDFVYYTPKGVEYTTTYVDYTTDEEYRITGEGKPYKGAFFFKYKDGNGGAYCTFMGGDMKLTRVVTSTKNGRRLMILKDSFGNALPGYLFFSFEEIHVIDSRYFIRNMIDYVREHHITDILFANNIFKAYSAYTYRNYMKFLTQQASDFTKHEAVDSLKTDSAVAAKAIPSIDSTALAPAIKNGTDSIIN